MMRMQRKCVRKRRKKGLVGRPKPREKCVANTTFSPSRGSGTISLPAAWAAPLSAGGIFRAWRNYWMSSSVTTKPSTTSLMPIIHKLERKLSTWRASLLSRGDRLALIRHVLCAIPMHFITAIAFNPSILKQANRIIHGFLRAGSTDAKGGQCLVN